MSPRIIGRAPHRLGVIVVAMLAAAATMTGFAPFDTQVASASVVADDDWLGIVNAYRSMSGLDPVTSNAVWSAEAAAHSCYMLDNGISHDEIPGNPGYTPGGDTAGNSGNVAVSSATNSTARNHIDLWMTGPFHAIGILRHSLTQSGYGSCSRDDTATIWKSGGTLDVIRGIDHTRPRPSTPILFPAHGSTVPLTRFITEFPDPMAMCGWSGVAGLPLLALMPNDISTASAVLSGPDGPIETCVLHENNVPDPTAKALLSGDNAVVVMPRVVLGEGAYAASVTTDAGNVSWGFATDPDTPLSSQPTQSSEPANLTDTRPTSADARFEPISPIRTVDSRRGLRTTRLRADNVTRIKVADPGVAAFSANFVAVNPAANGFLTAYNCTDERPTVSTLNYRANAVTANHAAVPLADGDVCVYSKAATDLVIDVNGYYRPGGQGDRFVAVTPTRVLDTRRTGRLRAGREARVIVGEAAGGAPSAANAVALNVAAINPSQPGWLKVYPCDSAADSQISSLNYAAGEVRPNRVVVPVEGGLICMLSLRDTDVTIDLTGYFGDVDGFDYVPLVPIRVFDSRSTSDALNHETRGARLRAGQTIRIPIAGERGVPSDAGAVSINLAATQPRASTFLTAYPCSTRPATANVNVSPAQNTTASGTHVKLSPGGDLCIYSRESVHVIVDVNGIWH